MSLYIDIKYVSLLSPKLERFTRKSEYLWNFRCPICGDSHKNKFKARGYIYRQKSNLFFSCHNCGTSISLGNLLKTMDRSLFKEYQMDRFKNESAGNVAKPDFSAFKAKPVFDHSRKIRLPTIESLSDDHSAKQFISKRKVPKSFWSELFYADDFAGFVKEIFPEYDRELKKEDPRIVIPFYNKDKKLLGFQGRAVLPSAIKYITIKFNDDSPKLFGLERLDTKRRVYVVEGPIDSMFLPNAIATMDASLYSVISTLGHLDYVFVYDNEPRNKEVCRNIEKTIAMDQKVVIWPTRVAEKDINDMILSGKSPDEILSLIDSNTSENLKAKLEFVQWKKV